MMDKQLQRSYNEAGRGNVEMTELQGCLRAFFCNNWTVYVQHHVSPGETNTVIDFEFISYGSVGIISVACRK